PENLGPAGAAAVGFERLAAAGCDWIAWIDDDDPPGVPDVFERLLAVAEAEGDDLAAVGAFGSRFDWRRGRAVRLADRELRGVVEVDLLGGSAHPLFRTAAVEAVGLPDAALFFGLEEWSFALRLRRAGFRLAVDGEVMLGYRERAGRLGRRAVHPLLPPDPPHALWRRYYTTRNYIVLMRRTFGRPDLARRQVGRALARSASAWGRGLRYGLRFTRLELRAVADGWAGRLGRRVEPPAAGAVTPGQAAP
ncbi:MAG TPA: hypothetical protein VF150_10825, partial [Thermoanaerobaculia bacterium]